MKNNTIGKSKGSVINRKLFMMALLMASYMVNNQLVAAQVTSANSATTIHNAANGVPVVDIANPNGAGLSHNKFNDYNVDNKGLVLNNGDISQVQRTSKLAGVVSPNLHLKSEAKMILNEVISTNRSKLAGYTEVVGGTADVIVANPNGITCNGCGFINTPSVTLTTGIPNIDTTGKLAGFGVKAGDILITGKGLDASQQDYLGLIARSLKLRGQTNAKVLDIIAGANNVDYATKKATAIAGAGIAPTLAIDSSALGGMYVDRIRLVATEAGVGVKMLGDAAADAGDFTLDSAGKIEIESKLSAKGNMRIASTAKTPEAVKETSASLTSEGDLTLSAVGGQIHLLGGVLTAKGNMLLQSDGLNDESNTDTLTDNNKRYAVGALTLNQSGTTLLDNTSYGAGKTLSASAGNFDVGSNGETLYGKVVDLNTAGNLSLAGAAVQSHDGLTLTATTGKISASSATRQGVESVAGDVGLTAGGGITNAGTISAAAGALKVRSNGIINNSGTLYAKNGATLADKTGGSTVDITNSGKLMADTSLQVKADTLDNSGGMQGTGGSTFTLTRLINSGTFIASNSTISAGKIIADTLTNTASGILQSAQNLRLYIKNRLTNNNKIFATKDLNVAGQSGTTLTVVNNSSGVLNAGGQLSITGDGNDAAKLATQLGKLIGNNLKVHVAALTNAGTIQGGASNNTITVDGTLTNNSGAILNLANKDGGSGYVFADTLTNNGELESAGTLNLQVKGTLTDGNDAKILAAKNMTIAANKLILGNSNSAIIAGQSGTGTGNIKVDNDFTNPGVLYSGGDLMVEAPNITNSSTGALAASGTLHTASQILKNYGQIFAGTLVDVKAGDTVTNEEQGSIDGTQDIKISTGHFYNYHNINAGRNLEITSTKFFNEIPGGDKRLWSSDNRYWKKTYGGWDDDIPLGALQHRSVYFSWQHQQYYSITRPSVKPELVAGGILAINDFVTAVNLGAVISGATVNITSSRGGAKFTNDDYGLYSKNYTKTNIQTKTCYVFDCTDPDLLFSGPVKIHKPYETISGDGGIYAGTLNASGFSLSNISSPYAAKPGTKSASGTLAGSASAGASASSLTVGRITISLPSSPNGLFIVSRDPNSKYLIETNPLYKVGSSFLGSDYMLKRYGVDPDTVERRLGSASYEASLIRQQLLNKGAAALLNTGDEAAAMQKLMDSGADQGLGLTVGVAPMSDQLAKLTDDMVWMVDTVVAGQHVLAPVVYLSAVTKSQIVSGAVIQASNSNLELASLNNRGGTISGSDNLNITTQGNLTNTSGTISGGNVALTSTGGDIINQTVAETTGGTGNQHTSIGHTAGIVATGNLNIDAKNDIINKGANMSAGGDAALKAGRNITFDTVEDKESTSTHSGSNTALGGGTRTDTTASSTTNLHSGLTVSGNLSTNSGKDTTLAGTDANISGNADIKTGGNLTIIARNDSTETSSSSASGTVFSGDKSTKHDRETTNSGSSLNVGGNMNASSGGDTTIQGSNINVKGNGSIKVDGNINILDGQNSSDTSSTSSHSGTGVGSGLYGKKSTVDTDQKSTSVASNIHFGGNGTLSADKDLTVQGSNVATGGNLDIDATNVNILEGRNNETHTHTESTTTIGKIASSSSGSANANADAHGGVTLSETNTTTTTHTQSHAASSSLSSGSGSITISAKNDVTLRGSTINASSKDKAVTINAKNFNELAAVDIDRTTTISTDTKLGLYGSSNNKADANANANANASGGGEGSPSAGASANAQANASSDNTLDYLHTDKKTDKTVDITHTGSSIHSGGKMIINVTNNLNVNGSSLDSGGDMDLKAKNMSFTDANDSHTERKTDSATKMGMYLDTGANAKAQANAGAKGISANGGSSAGARVNEGVGIYGSNTTTSSVKGTTTAQTSFIHSGGNMERSADNNITDEGTQIDAGGKFTQSSKTWNSNAAKNTAFSSDSSKTNTAKLGEYKQANAGASEDISTLEGVKEKGVARASVGVEDSYGLSTDDSRADASGGVEASYSRKTDDSSAASSNAVVSNIHSGGGMTITTTGKTSLEGTNIGSGDDMTLNAGSLDYKAAHNTTSKSGKTTDANADLKAGVSATKDVDFSANGGYSQDKNSSSSSTAVTGGMNSGGNLHINTKNDANFEGTNLAAKGDAGIKAGGDVNFKAAHNTKTNNDKNFNASAGVSLSKSSGGSKGAGFNAKGGYGQSSSKSDDVVVGSISSDGKLDVVSSKGNATFEGANLKSGGDASVTAKKGDVNFKAAKSTSSSTGFDVSGSTGGSSGGAKTSMNGKEEKKGREGLLDVEGTYSKDNKTTSAVSSINSGGKLTVKSGYDVNLEGTSISSQGSAVLDADHDVNFKVATNTSDKVDFSGKIDLKPSRKAPEEGEKGKTKNKGFLSLGLSGEKSITKTGGSINAGSISIKSGNNTTLEGTKTKSAGDTSINAGGSVKLATADSSHIEGGIGAAGGTSGGELTKASIGGGVDHQETDMSSGGDMKITSGGKTTLEGSSLGAGGSVDIDAKGGVKKKTVTSGGGDFGLDHAGVKLKVKKVDVNLHMKEAGNK